MQGGMLRLFGTENRNGLVLPSHKETQKNNNIDAFDPNGVRTVRVGLPGICVPRTRKGGDDKGIRIQHSSPDLIASSGAAYRNSNLQIANT
jgi:hypothetical protein